MRMVPAKQESESIELAVLLALSGGIMDTYSYLVRDHVFANAQTGNMLLFGIHLSAGRWIECLHYGVPVACFAAGIALCHVIKIAAREEHLHWRQVALVVEAAFLVVVGFIPEGHSLWANGLTSFACGIQVQAFRKFHGRPLATTMCIGNLRSGTQSLVSWVNSRDDSQLSGGLLSFFVIVCFVIGAVLGNWLRPALGTRMILVAPALLLVSFLILFVDRERAAVEKRVESDLEADITGEPVDGAGAGAGAADAADANAPQLKGIAAAEYKLTQRLAADVEKRMGADIELDVMHDMGLTSQKGAAPTDEADAKVERDVEEEIEKRLREHIARGGWRAQK